MKRTTLPSHPRPLSRLVVGAAIIASAALTIRVGLADDLETRLVGRQADGSVVLPTNQIVKPAGAQVEFLGRPNVVALSPDGKTAAFLNGAYQAIILVDVASATVKQEFTDAGSSASFDGLVYAPDGSRLYASQANGGIIVADVQDDGTITLNQRFDGLPKSPIVSPGREDGNPYPGSLALSDDGNSLYVVLNRSNTLAELDLGKMAVVREIPVGNAPHSVVVNGNRAYVSNQGGRPASETDFTNDSSGTPIVADPYSGSAATGTISIVDLDLGAEIKTIEVGLHPTTLLLDGPRLFVANSNSDTVSVIHLGLERVVKTIGVEPFPGAKVGSSPNGLALIGSRTLLVSLGRNNAIALYRLGERVFDAVEFKGLIPTAWYPTSVVTDPETRRIIVANGKGLGSLGPEATVGPDPATNKTGPWVHSNLGSASIIPYPSETALERYTKEVYENNNWSRIAAGDDDPDGKRGKEHRAKPLPIPEKLGDPSVFKHVFYIIKENRTYDQILGDLLQGNGDIDMLQFGREVTPNQHAIAEQFVLFDNLYDSGSNSADGHQWVTQAFVVDYLEKSYGGFVRTYPFNGGDALAYGGGGFLWENALAHGKGVRVYGEYVSGLLADGVEMGPWVGWLQGGVTTAGTWTDYYEDAQILASDPDADLDTDLHVDLEAHSDIPSLQAIINADYPPYNMVIPDQYRVEVFLREFRQYVENGNLPEFVVMCLTNDHTEGLDATYPTPRAMIADNDLALGRVVEAITRSPYWKDSVIFVIEDDAQNGVDHVDGHRTIGFVVSPYTKREVVDNRYYTQIDFVRTMEQILGLPPMNQMDMAVDPTGMKHVFTTKPNLTPFVALPNQIPLDELNPDLASLDGIHKAWAVASGEMDFSAPDTVDSELLNRAIWYSAKGFDRPYPGDERVLAPAEVHPYLKAKAEQAAKPKG